MKAITCFFFLLLFACEPPVIFREPQPAGIEDETTFRTVYQGDYLCTGDSSVLKIREKDIYLERALFFVDDVDGVGFDSLLRQEEVMTDDEGPQLRYFLEGEPVPLENVLLTDEVFVGTLLIRDTLFSIGQDQRLRYYRGHLVLNHYRDDLNWEVALLSQEINGDLRLSMAKLPEDLAKIEQITPVKKQLTGNGDEQLLLNPSRGEFRQLMQNHVLFEECAYYERIPDYSWVDKLFQ